MTDQPPPPLDDPFFMEIESHFSFRRGTPFLVSAKDWGLMKKWHDEQVPLPLVLEAIDSCFDKQEQSGRKRTISSLSYCRHAVKDLWEERKQLSAGSAGGSVADSDPAGRLALLAAQLDESALHDPSPAVRTVIVTASGKLRELSVSRSVPQIEQRLLDLENELVHQLLGALPEESKQELNARVSELLGSVPESNTESFNRTREANLKRLVRQLTGIPRLSLFG